MYVCMYAGNRGEGAALISTQEKKPLLVLTPPPLSTFQMFNSLMMKYVFYLEVLLSVPPLDTLTGHKSKLTADDYS